MSLPNSELADDTQARVLEAAGKLFAVKGFEGATVREICQNAGVNIAAVNYYFRDKERLYIETVKSACQRQAQEFPFPDWPAGTPAVARLRDFIHTMARRMLNDDAQEWCRQLFLREMGHPTSACAELVRDHMQPTGKILSAILRDLMPAVPETRQTLTAFSIVGQVLFYKLAAPVVSLMVGDQTYRQLNAELIAEHVTQFTLAALGLAETPEPKRRKKSGKESNQGTIA